MKNGVPVGTNDSVYADSTLDNDDVISCILTSSESCAIPATKVSNGLKIRIYEPPVAAFTLVEIIDNITGNIQLINNSERGESYAWDFGNGQYSNEENPTVYYNQDGSYPISLVTTSAERCTDTAWSKYAVEFFGLYIPNAFAPASNVTPANLFKPAGANLKQYRIEVFDSWGNKLWESTALDSEGSPSEAWDGTYRGELMPQGTYMWKVEAVFNDNTVWQGCDIGHGKGKNIGTVTLLK
jgi:gliding motility-associated-like protein